jgi:hypothetical protein
VSACRGLSIAAVPGVSAVLSARYYGVFTFGADIARPLFDVIID